MCSMDIFQFHFQPKVDTQNNQIIGYEILLRNKMEYPYYPASAMEEIINDQQKHALFIEWFQKELKELVMLFPTINFSINLAPKQLLYKETHLFLREMQSFQKQLILEITEAPILFVKSAEFLDSEIVDSYLERAILSIKEKGYTLSLDDVGSGRNSLDQVLKYAEYINQIKFSLIKCVHRGMSEEACQLFLTAWKGFAETYQLELVIEGIEDQFTSECIKEQGISLQQGYHFGKPSKNIKNYRELSF
jgi:EAL domain-containing protein (putative c-di-GMP-specific phosphodiesterase class I)